MNHYLGEFAKFWWTIALKIVYKKRILRNSFYFRIGVGQRKKPIYHHAENHRFNPKSKSKTSVIKKKVINYRNVNPNENRKCVTQHSTMKHWGIIRRVQKVDHNANVKDFQVEKQEAGIPRVLILPQIFLPIQKKLIR